METKIEKLPENLVKVEIVVPAKEAVDYYYEQAQKCTCGTSGDVGQRRQLRKELQERFGLLEIEAVNILSGVHGTFYVEKYNRIRNCTPLKSESTKGVLDKED